MDDIEAFLAVVESGSQTAAARKLGRTLQSVNRSLMGLERSVGIELVRRTTRQSVPTEAGVAFYRRVKPAFTEIAEARVEAVSHRKEPAGPLRIAAPIVFGATYIVPVVAEFIARYPRIEVDLRVSDEPVDVVAEGCDLAVRIRELPDSSLKARRLGKLRVVAYGSPGYFKRHGRPAHISDLARHRCVVRSTIESEANNWRFRVGGRNRFVRVNGSFRSDNAAAVLAAARHGLGVGYGPFWQARDWLDQGVLETVLQEFEAPPIPVQAVFPPSRTPSAKARLFTDLLAERLRRERL